MRAVSASLVTAGASPLLPAAAQAGYDVDCDQGRILVDSRRDPEQMHIARVSGFCRMGPAFDDLSDTQAFAQRNFGGQGWACACC